MKLHENISVGEAKMDELKKGSKKDAVAWIKKQNVFGGISKKAAANEIEKVYAKIKSWRTPKKVEQVDKVGNIEND